MNLAKSILFFSWAVSVIGFSQEAFPSGWKAGVSSALITPGEPMWTAGYGGRTEPASETISDIFVKALAIEDPGGEKIVIITADFVGYSYEFPHDVSKVIEKKWGLKRESLFFNASHTHCAPAIENIHGIPDEYSAKIIKYNKWFQVKCVEVIDNALKKLSPANLSFSTARPTPFAVSRRFPDGKGGVIYRSSPSSYYTQGPRDDTSPVLRVASPDGKIIAILFGYACHPITISENKYSADYPGFAQKYLEEAFPGAVAMFMQGCGGELVPNARYQVQYAMGHGKALADAVKRSVESEQTLLSGPLKIAYKESDLNFAPVTMEAMEKLLAVGTASEKTKAALHLKNLGEGKQIKTKYPFPFQAVSFGKELLLVGFPGDTVTDYSVNAKKEFSDKAKFVWAAGYSNYCRFYLPSLRVLREGGYEGNGHIWSTNFPGPFAEDVEDIVMSSMRDLVNSVTK